MFDENKKKVDIDMENVAVPEIHVHGDSEKLLDEETTEVEEEIDYSGAIPVYHPHKKS